MESSIA